MTKTSIARVTLTVTPHELQILEAGLHAYIAVVEEHAGLHRSSQKVKLFPKRGTHALLAHTRELIQYIGLK